MITQSLVVTGYPVLPSVDKLEIVKTLTIVHTFIKRKIAVISHLPQASYRQISVLPKISKILEKIVFSIIVILDCLNDIILIFITRFGYLRKKSTKLALFDFLSKFNKLMVNYEFCDIAVDGYS